MSIVEVENVSKKFKSGKKDFFALKDVSFDIKKGEIFGLLGPNGAGKSTLLNILIGILFPDSGNVKIFGKNPLKNNDLFEKMNFVSGETRFHWALKVKDILEFHGRLYGIPKNKRITETKKLAKFFEIEHILENKFSNISTGEKMRLIMAKALLNNPKLLLLDEPTVGLDPDIAIKTRNEIKRINKKLGTTIILTSHYMHEIEQLCDRIAFINKGVIVDIGSVDSVKLRKFASYDLTIKVRSVKNREFLRRKGFLINGNILRKELPADENISETLSMLAEKGMEIIEIESRKPTLEDYFVKMLGDKK
ncbi:MAG: ABC transporter ATP-binding protein [Candidatus Aenigmarchaeota archaeon]|nr:ABC transporter ATP-binding protein [Candidatus Aenigmarchaeota archaeon]